MAKYLKKNTLSVWSVSSNTTGDTAQMIAVLALPPKEF